MRRWYNFNNKKDIKVMNKDVRSEEKIKQLEQELNIYRSLYHEAKKELERYTKKNPRNAGRKKQDETWMNKYIQFSMLMNSNTSKEDIISNMGISQATYYRFRNFYRTDENATLKQATV